MADKVKHGVVRTDRMAGTDVRSELVSVKYMKDGEQLVIDNGNLLDISAGLMDGEREIYNGAAPTAASKINDIVLVASPEVMYDERLRDLADFYNEVGKTARAYHLVHSDIFSVTLEALEGSDSPAVGDKVGYAAGKTKIQVGTGTAFGKIIAVDQLVSRTYYAIQVD